MNNTVYSLGIELSTQSVKLVLLDIERTEVVYTSKNDYDAAFPQYHTVGGVLPFSQSGIRHTSPLMLMDALDRAFLDLMEHSIDTACIRVIKVDAMQHCTVYANASCEGKLKALRPEKTLAEQLESCISRSTSPIWEDRSTAEEASALTSLLQDKGGISALTGNRAELRFPAAQIMKWAKEYPEEYNRTQHIFLLSAFITSLLTGRIAAVDTGDGWGTNLNTLDINKPGWNTMVLDMVDSYLKKAGCTDPLCSKLGRMDHYDSVAGTIHAYFVNKYGLQKDTVVMTGTGDNPASLMGCGGGVVISLGSSYTVNGIMNSIVPDPDGGYNVFGFADSRAMALSCITNGGKVHEHFLRRYIMKSGNGDTGKLQWDSYTAKTGEPQLSRDEPLILPYLMDESVPLCGKGIIRERLAEDDAAANIRALHVSQALSLKLHSRHLNRIDALCVVAGGAKNTFLRQLITDVFAAGSFTVRNADYAAPFGCALSGAKKLLNISYEDAFKRFIQKDKDSLLFPLAVNEPIVSSLHQTYRKLESGCTGGSY